MTLSIQLGGNEINTTRGRLVSRLPSQEDPLVQKWMSVTYRVPTVLQLVSW